MNLFNMIRGTFFKFHSKPVYAMLALEYDEESSGIINNLQKYQWKVTALSSTNEQLLAEIIVQSFGTAFETIAIPYIHAQISFVVLKEDREYFFNPFTKLLLFRIGYMNKSGTVLSNINISNEGGQQLIQNITAKLEPVLSYMIDSNYSMEGEIKNGEKTNIA